MGWSLTTTALGKGELPEWLMEATGGAGDPRGPF